MLCSLSPLQARTKGRGMKILDPAPTDEGNAAAEGAGWHFNLTH